MNEADPLEQQYASIIRYLESRILERVPRVPLMTRPRGLDEVEVRAVAQMLADAARQMGVR